MVMMAGLELPVFAIRRQIASSINLIVHMARLQDGSRRITNITEIVGMEGEIVTTQDIFRFEQTGTGKSGQILGDLRRYRNPASFLSKAGDRRHKAAQRNLYSRPFALTICQLSIEDNERLAHGPVVLFFIQIRICSIRDFPRSIMGKTPIRN
jgi:hypothetical protein